VAGFGAAAALPLGATPESVAVRVRHSETPPGQLAGLTAQAYVGATPVGSPQALTVGAGDHDDIIIVTGLSAADLADLRVRIVGTRV